MKNQQADDLYSATKPIDYTGYDAWLHQQSLLSTAEDSSNQKTLSFLDSPIRNVMVLLLLTTIAYMLALTMDLRGADIGSLMKIFAPCITGFITLLAYFIGRMFFKPYAWIVTLTGITYMLYCFIGLI
jgi:hypothetical protein